MKFTDEILMAYTDGELDAELRAQVEAAITHDPLLAQKIAQHRRLSQRLHSELDSVLSEPIPDRLLATLRSPVANTQPETAQNVVALPVRKNRWSTREWSAIAAALVLGGALGIVAPAFKDRSVVTSNANGLVAQGALANALTAQLAANQHGTDAVQIGLSFKTRDGDYCRTFSLKQQQEVAGLACHQNNAWRVQMLTAIRRDETTGMYRQAGSATPAAILTWVDQAIADEPLDASGEAAAQRSGWK